MDINNNTNSSIQLCDDNSTLSQAEDHFCNLRLQVELHTRNIIHSLRKHSVEVKRCITEAETECLSLERNNIKSYFVQYNLLRSPEPDISKIFGKFEFSSVGFIFF